MLTLFTFLSPILFVLYCSKHFLLSFTGLLYSCCCNHFIFSFHSLAAVCRSLSAFDSWIIATSYLNLFSFLYLALLFAFYWKPIYNSFFSSIFNERIHFQILCLFNLFRDFIYKSFSFLSSFPLIILFHFKTPQVWCNITLKPNEQKNNSAGQIGAIKSSS